MTRMTKEEKARRAADRAETKRLLAEAAAELAAKDANEDIGADNAEDEMAVDALEHGTDEEDTKPRGMAKTLSAYKAGYELSITASGNKSLSNGDELARFLEGKDHDDVMRIAETALDLGTGFLAAKYERLNNGAKRMNSGNRLRGAMKRGVITIEEIAAAA